MEKPGEGTSFLNTRCALLCHGDQITLASKLLDTTVVGYEEARDGTGPENLKRKYLSVTTLRREGPVRASLSPVPLTCGGPTWTD